MKFFLALILTLCSCTSTPEGADRQATLLFAVAGGLDEAALTATDADLAEELADIATGARALAALVRASGVEDENEQVLAYIGEVQGVIRLVLPSVSERMYDKLSTINILLGVLKELYAPPEQPT